MNRPLTFPPQVALGEGALGPLPDARPFSSAERGAEAGFSAEDPARPRPEGSKEERSESGRNALAEPAAGELYAAEGMGDPLSPRSALWSGWAALALLGLGLAGWGWGAILDSAIVAPGVLMASPTFHGSSPPARKCGREKRRPASRPQSKRAPEGDRVEAGAPLLALDAKPLAAERAVLAGRLAAAEAERARLQAEKEAARGNFAEVSVENPALEAEPQSREELEERAQSTRLGAAGAALGISAAASANIAWGLLSDAKPPAPSQQGTVPSGDDPAAVHLQRTLFEARAEAFHMRLSMLQAEAEAAERLLSALERRRIALAEERALLNQERSQIEALASAGLAPDTRRLANERALARLAGEEAALAAEIELAQARRAHAEEEAALLHATRAEEAAVALAALVPQIAELEARLAVLDERIARLTLTAPVAGRIHGLAFAGAGSVIRPAEPILELIPDGPPRYARILIRPDDIDRIEPGQNVRLALPATGGRPREEVSGRIMDLPADATHDPKTGARVYLVNVALAAEDLARLSSRRLTSGQPVEAFVLTGRQRPLTWLLSPLTDALFRAFRGG